MGRSNTSPSTSESSCPAASTSWRPSLPKLPRPLRIEWRTDALAPNPYRDGRHPDRQPCAARAIAEIQDRPLIQLSPTFVAWKGYDEEVAAPLRLLPGADAYRARFARWLTENGTSTTDVDAFSGPPGRALAMIPRAMQPHADQVDTGTVTFVGPCFEIGAGAQVWTRPADAEKVLLISLGSAYTRQPEFYRQCLRAYGDLPGWHVVLQIGKHTDPAELGAIPPNVEVHSWVPQRAILAVADAFVTHAGMGGSAEGLLAGVPMIAVPQAAEQFINADRLVELGVARRIDTGAATAAALRTALTELTTDPEVARRSALLRAEALAEGGTRRAADLIEEAVPAAGFHMEQPLSEALHTP
ncbi:macrolide family glycosyltransferase [Nocardia sp. JCM 34519.1]|uniref:macrolide family glycosyltransferase n=1 Tax=Nocardia sp. JCM 34519.1 TaxID=2876119 RepID=UPI001CE49E33|nr:macrolide family glycosyltransferase [Nocardia sp. JCM 34519.1]